jgi:ectoine hydroxylase-related dioxygenase (phytanoyl-CoA dioxygenase family)
MPSGALAEELIADFRRDGFVVVDDLLSFDELDVFAPLVAAAVAVRSRGDERPLAERSRYEQSFRQCMNLWEDFAGVRPLTFHQRIGGVAAALLGVPTLRLWHDQALFKDPGGLPTEAHQDQPYWPIAETASVTAWIPLDGATMRSGCLGYVPGSHRAGVHQFVNIFRGDDGGLLEHEAFAGTPPVFREVPRGAVAFHHGLTAHCSMPNASAQTRRVHTMIYVDADATRNTERAHFIVERPGIAVGQPIASALTPIAFPRPAGDLPEPPPW